MTNSEKVRLAVVHCLRSNDCSVCEACPYNVGNDHGCRARLRDDIITQLRAQESRVMTKSELDDLISSFDGEARVWIEHRKLGLYCASLWSSNPSRGDDNFYDVTYEHYYERLEIGHWWRPWTSRPTDEQREAVKWE